jgi:hypothetical protein
VAWIIPLFLGLSEFSSIAQKPRFEMYRTVDVVGLLVYGGCFILALAGHLASGSTSHVGARRGHPAGARSHILADTTATSVGTSVAPTPAMTVDRAKLQQLPEQLDVLLASANRR